MINSYFIFVVKIRLIFIKQFPFDKKYATNECFSETKSTKKIFLTDLFVWNKMVQSSLKWLLGSSRRYKHLTWRSQGQLQSRLRLGTKLQIKRIHNTHTHLWRILRYKSIIDKVSLKLHKALSKTFCLDTVNFFFYSSSGENANSQCPVIIVMISRVPNQYPKWLFSYSNHPSGSKTYWLLLTRSHSSSRQKLVPTSLAVYAFQGRFGMHHKVHSK